VIKISPADVKISKGKDGKVMLTLPPMEVENVKGKPSESGKTIQLMFASTGKALQVPGYDDPARITVRFEVVLPNSPKTSKKLEW